jgi:hypothetical protein
VLGAAGVVLLVVLGAAAWLAWDAKTVRDDLASATDDVSRLRDGALEGDAETAALAELQSRAAAAHRVTNGPVWRATAHVPWIGDQIGAVRTASAVVDDLAQRALPPLLDAVRKVNPTTLAPRDGRVDLAPLEAVAPQILGADDAVRAATDRLAAIDTTRLVRQVATPVTQLRGMLDEVGTTVGTAAKAVALLPPMLGADGPRTYLVLVQNNAELRATGGIPGSVLLVRAQDGKVEVVDQVNGGSLVTAEPALPLTDAEQALFGPDLGRDMRDVTFTPDFPRTAELAAALWQRKGHGPVDGVLSVDPGTLALILGATGPVSLPDGSTLTADNAVASLLNDVYRRFTKPADQDAYFAMTAAAVFKAVAGGQGSPTRSVDALAEAARQGRLMVWSAHDDERARLAGTVLDGALRGVRGDSPVIGVYLNDGTQAKLGYYLKVDVKGTVTECRADGTRLVDVVVTLTAATPPDLATLPSYLVGNGDVVARGVTRTNVLIYAPSGGGIESFRVNSRDAGAFSQTHDELSVGAVTMDLDPGQTGTLDVQILTGPQPGEIDGRVTPTAHGAGTWSATTACG